MDKIKIEVYGGTNLGGGGCSCGCTSCTPADAKAEYDEARTHLLHKYGEDSLSLEYIDTDGGQLSQYPDVEKVVRAGYSFPITVINGAPRLAGAVASDAIIEIVTEMQAG